MFAKSYGATTLGVDGLIIDVEVDAGFGFPAFDIVGLPDTAVRESKERVRTAIKNSGIKLKQEKVTINLAPADIRKDSSGLDLPIAVGLLAAHAVLPVETLAGNLFAAELSLEGECRPVQPLRAKPVYEAVRALVLAVLSPQQMQAVCEGEERVVEVGTNYLYAGAPVMLLDVGVQPDGTWRAAMVVLKPVLHHADGSIPSL